MITPVYAALLALVLVVLSFRVLLMRRKMQIAVGTDGNVTLARAIGAHANFIEYVPITLMLIYFYESAGVASWFVHLLCAVLLVGRLIHAYGVSQLNENFVFRVSGMVMTLGVLISISVRTLLSTI